MRKNMIFAVIMILVAAMLCCGCSQSSSNGPVANDPGDSSELMLSHAALELPLENARGRLYAFHAADPAALEWSTDDSTVVNVSGGLITPVSVGTATVTCTDGVNTASCTVTIRDTAFPDYTLKIADNELSVALGDSGRVEYTYTGSGAVAVFSSHPEILRLENGRWEAVAAGTAFITVSDGLMHTQCCVTVTEPAA